MQRLVTRNIKDETMEHVPYIYNNQAIYQGSPHKPQCTMWLHIYRKQQKTGSYTWTFLYIVGASDSTAHDITKSPNDIGLETHSSAIRRGAFYYPVLLPGRRWSHRGTQCEWPLYTEYALSTQAENSQILSHSFFRWLSAWNNNGEI